jgi:hypothetical protein
MVALSIAAVARSSVRSAAPTSGAMVALSIAAVARSYVRSAASTSGARWRSR